MERKEIHYETGMEMDYSDLDPRFEKYFASKEWVEVVWKPGFEDYFGYGARTDGKKARFYVGMSGGWKPIYLQIYNKRSQGGAAILSEAVESIRGLGVTTLSTKVDSFFAKQNAPPKR